MAHEVETMMSVKEIPWHGLGTILQSAPTTAEAMKQAGLDWNVEARPLFLGDGRAVEAKAIVRTSDEKILGHHVGEDWTPIQNAEAFGFFDPIVSSGQATYETAGSLRGGTRVWVLARVGSEDSVIVPKADDRVRKYLLLSNSHDGTLAARVGFTPTRVVCANTLRMAHDSAESALLRLLHTKNVKDTLEQVRDIIDLANQRFEATAEQYRRLARTSIVAKDLEKYVSRVFDAPVPTDPRGSVDEVEELMATFAKGGQREKNAKARYEMIAGLFEHGRGNDLPGVKGTVWAAYNAVTEYLSHERPRSSVESRLESLTFGVAGKTSQKALDLALAMTL